MTFPAARLPFCALVYAQPWCRYPALRRLERTGQGLLRCSSRSCWRSAAQSLAPDTVAVYAAFASAPDALAAALAVQRSLASGADPHLAVRLDAMALHTGVAGSTAGRYGGQTLERAARLMDAGNSCLILLSLAAQELVRDHLPPDIVLHDLGEHHLADLQRPERIFVVGAVDQSPNFQLLHTLNLHLHNLPLQPTPFIGREYETHTLRDTLLRSDVRLLTLTGPGGTGKTRLALQVAADVLPQFADGVFVVSLTPIRDAALVASAIAQTLGHKEGSGLPLPADLQNFLHDKQMLLVLDNFEQVLDAAPLVAELIASAPRLKVLATSRAVLGVYGEHNFLVPPLALPDRQHLPPLEHLSQYESVRLFIERSQAAKLDFTVTIDTAPAVAEICFRLDGLPLAIELAAARVRLLSPPALLSRLSNRLKLLTGGPRTLPMRQQTLRSTIEWSYQLLSTPEQVLFRRLAVFVGGRSVEACAAVCAAPGDLDLDMLDGLQSLLDKSLPRQVDDATGEPRFMMLETIWEYALEQLEASGEADQLRRAHAVFFEALTQRAARELHGPDQRLWLHRLEHEHDNLRAALRWAKASDDPELGLRLASSLSQFWDRHGDLSEGRAWLEQFLQLPAAALVAIRAKALSGAGILSANQGDYQQALALHHASLVLRREAGDKQGIAVSLNSLGDVFKEQGDYAAARAVHLESLALKRELGDTWGVATSLGNLANIARRQGNYATARPLFEECLATFRSLGDVAYVAVSLLNLGAVFQEQGAYAEAQRLYHEALALQTQLGNKSAMASLLCNLGNVQAEQGQFVEAAALHQQSRALHEEVGDKEGVATVLLNMGVALLRQNQLSAAADLLSQAHPV